MTIYEPFIPTTGGLITTKLRLAGVRPGERLFDLGCGDGRVLVEAARDFQASCVGYELRPDLAKEAEQAVEESGLADRVIIIRGDLMKADISRADVVVLYLSKEVMATLGPKLDSELRQGTRVVTHTFGVPGWKPIRQFRLRATGRHVIDDVFLYVAGDSVRQPTWTDVGVGSVEPRSAVPDQDSPVRPPRAGTPVVGLVRRLPGWERSGSRNRMSGGES